jgi:hypothetical protein
MTEDEKKELGKRLLEMETQLNAMYENINYLMDKYEL